MGHENTNMDVESLQKSGHRRGRCVDTCLVISLVVLFVAVAAVAAGLVLVFKHLQFKVQPLPRPCKHEGMLEGDADDSVYKMQNFAYLEAISCELKNSTMHWAAIRYGTRNSVGSNFLFDSKQHSLQLLRKGAYFMYVDLNFTCPHRCTAGIVTVQLGDKLTCEAELPAANSSKPVTKKCWTVNWINTPTRLSSQMTVSKDGLQNWKLDFKGSGFGMFLVD